AQVLVVNRVWELLVNGVATKVAWPTRHQCDLFIDNIGRPKCAPLTLDLCVVWAFGNICAQSPISSPSTLKPKGVDHMDGVSKYVPGLGDSACAQKIKGLEHASLDRLQLWGTWLGIRHRDGSQEELIAVV